MCAFLVCVCAFIVFVYVTAACAILYDRSVKCWGRGDNGRLGYDSHYTKGLLPGDMASIGSVFLGLGKTARSITAGCTHTCAELNDGSLKCWGDGSYGRLGYDSTDDLGDASGEMAALQPVFAASMWSRVISVVSGTYFHCALFSNGDVKCWGYNYAGQLGQLHTNYIGDSAGEMVSLNPIAFGGSSRTALQVTAGQYHACALMNNGGVKCWGEGESGRLGLDSERDIGRSTDYWDKLVVYADVDLRPSGWSGTFRALHVSAGSAHTCALLQNHQVKCWGKNNYGQLGIGNTNTYGHTTSSTYRMSAIPAVDFSAGLTAVAITAGYGSHSCAVLSDGTARCWGNGQNGQIGAAGSTWVGNWGDTSSRPMSSLGPINLGENRTAVAVSAGVSYTCAVLDNGELVCWGQNGYGQLGVGSKTQYGCATTCGSTLGMDILPTVYLGPGKTAISVRAGLYSSCALLNDGSVKCWGQNSYGLLGQDSNGGNIGDATGEMEALQPVYLGIDQTALGLSTMRHSTCVIVKDARVNCWGWKAYGQLGLSDGSTSGNLGDVYGSMALVQPIQFDPASPPMRQPPPPPSPPQPPMEPPAPPGAGGSFHTCVVTKDHDVKCWGSGAYGQLGQETTDDLGDAPGEMAALRAVYLGAGKTAIAVSVGYSHSCAILNDRSLKCWGMGNDGRLGYDSSDHKGDAIGEMASLGTVNLGLDKTALAVSAGADYTCALLNDHSIKCWGFNGFGQLGQDSTESIGDDVGEMAALSAVRLGSRSLAVAAGTSHTCALLRDHTVKCWGEGLDGRLGFDSVDTVGDAPGEMALLATVYLGTQSDGHVYTAVSITVGQHHTCAILNDGKLKCWGRNAHGQLGLDSTDDVGGAPGDMAALPPVYLHSGTHTNTAVEISAGCEHSALAP